MRPAGPLSSSPYNPRINKDRQWSSRDTQSTRCNFLYFDPEKRKKKTPEHKCALILISDLCEKTYKLTKGSSHSESDLLFVWICVLSSLTTHSSATSCIRRQTSVPTLFQSHNFVETKVIHLHIDPQIMYFILSCFLFMFLHIYDIFI